MNTEFTHFYKIEGESQSIILEESANPDPDSQPQTPQKSNLKQQQSSKKELRKIPKFITSESYFVNESPNSG